MNIGPRILAALLVIAAAGAATAQPVITSPAANQTFRAGPDFATDQLQDPWDFNNVEDIGPDPDQTNGWAPAQLSAARWNGTGATYLSGGLFRGQGGPAPHDMQVTMLYRGDAGAINTVRTGIDHPIQTSRYRKLAFKMRVTGASQVGQPVVYWYHTPYLPDESHLNRAGGVLFETIPAGDSPFRVFVIDLGAVTSTTGSTRLVEPCAPGSPGCTGVPAPWLNEPQVAGLRIDPIATGVQLIEMDWVRLTAADGPNAAMMTVNYGSCSGGSASLAVRDAAGVDTPVGTGSATSATFNYGIFPPGAYTLRVSCGNGTSSVPFTINAPPAVTVIDPDRVGDLSTDYQSTLGRPGDPWDFEQTTDIVGLSNVSTTGGGCQGAACGLVPSERPGAAPGSRMFRASSVGPPGPSLGDPAIEFLRGSTNPISSRRHRVLTFSLRLHRPYDLAVGSVARVLWGSEPYVDQTSTTTSQDIRVWPGFQTYTVDLGALTTANGGIETECLAHNPPCRVTTWPTRSIRSLRLDPHEFGDAPTVFDIDDVVLTAPDEVNLSGGGHPKGTFTIRYHVADPDSQGASYVTRILIDTDRNPANGFAATVATGLGSVLGMNQFAWTPAPGTAVGRYWVYVETTETRAGVTHTQGAYATGPLDVYSEQASSLQLSLTNPTAGTMVPFPFSLRGCAFDAGNTNGINVDDLFVFAVASQVPGRQPGETFTLGNGGQLGTLRFGPLTGTQTQVACDSVTNPSSPFRHAGYSISNIHLDSGVWLLRVMARSVLSNALVPLADVPVTVTQLTLAPQNFQATAAGHTVTVSFEAPSGGPAIGGYAVDGAHNPAFSPAAFTVIVPSAGTYSGQLGNGTFYLRVRSLASNGAPGMSSETRAVQVGVVIDPPAPPSLQVVQGSANPITLRWAAGGGGAPTSYTLHAGTSPGASNLAVAPMGGATSITTAAPPGVRVYVRVVASNGAGAATSNEVSFTVEPPSVPGAPTLAPPSVSGNTVTLSWTPPANAGQSGVTGYSVIARLPGSSAIVATLGVPGTAVSVPAGAGTYVVSVIANGASGPSAESNTRTVTVP